MHFQSICSDEEVRRSILRIFAQSIETANQANSSGWSVSLRGGGTYVNVIVGRIFVFSLKKDRLWVTLDDSALIGESREKVLAAALEGPLYNFASVPSAKSYIFDPAALVELWPHVEEAHHSTVREASASVTRTPVYEAFAAELLDEIDDELGLDLPHPVYEKGGLTESRVRELIDLVNSEYPGWSGFSDPAFEEDEVNYKQEIVRQAADTLSKSELHQLLESDSYDEIIHRLDVLGKKGNLLYLSVPTSGDLNILYRDDLDKANFCRRVYELLYGEGDGAERLTQYLEWIDQQGIPRSHNKWTFPTYFLFLLNPEEEMFVKPTIVREFIRLAGLEFGLGSRPTGDTYAAIRGAYRELGDSVSEYDPRDMIDLQGFVWAAVRASRRVGKLKELREKARAEMQRLQDDPDFQFRVMLKHYRGAQVQELLANPEKVTLDIFNHEIWRVLTSASLDGEDVTNLFRRFDLTPEELAELDHGLDSGGLELHGNFMWGSGTTVYGPMLRLRYEPGSPLEAIAETLRRAGGPLGIPDLLERVLKSGGKSLTEAELLDLVSENADYLELKEDGLRLVPDDEVRVRNIHRAIRILNDPSLSPEAKALALMKIPGFGRNIATGLVMVFHPDEFGIYNQPSRASVERLGLPAKDLATFERSLAYLQTELGAEDFFELDQFLWLLAHDMITIVNPKRSSYWWVNQGESYDAEEEGSFIWAPVRAESSKEIPHHLAVGRVLPGDKIIHYASGEIRAVGTVMELPGERVKPGSEGTKSDGVLGHYAPVAYEELPEPLSRDDIPLEWRKKERGPFNREGRLNQGYLFPISVAFVEKLVGDFNELADLLDVSGEESAFLFQANPSMYNLAEELGQFSPGDSDDWMVSKLEKEMKKGDAVYLWQSGKDAGMYATGTITGAVFERPAGDWMGDDAGKPIKAIPFSYDRILDRPLLRDEVKEDPILSQMHVMRAPTGTNFRVTSTEHRRLQELISGPLVPGPVSLDEVYGTLRSEGMRISETVLRRYHLALQTRGFVILAGLSGSGKTWLTQLYARAIGARYKLVPVAPNWTTNEDLLGYFNPLTQQYHDTAFSRFLREASAEYQRALDKGEEPVPYHVALDEMNLARVEYYFAQFLSAMEIRARQGTAEVDLGPDDTVMLPQNLFFIGTVNIDETTHGFADKVYDRAQLIELEAPRSLLAEHLGDAAHGEALLNVWDAVADVAPFAFRVLDEIESYVSAAEDLGIGWSEALDEQVVQKVLPKLKGADPRIGEALEALTALAGEKLPRTHSKAQAMHRALIEYGFTSYF